MDFKVLAHFENELQAIDLKYDGNSKFFLNKALFKGQKDYINSGVLLINIEQFKNEDTYGSILEIDSFDIDRINSFVEEFEESLKLSFIFPIP